MEIGRPPRGCLERSHPKMFSRTSKSIFQDRPEACQTRNSGRKRAAGWMRSNSYGKGRAAGVATNADLREYLSERLDRTQRLLDRLGRFPDRRKTLDPQTRAFFRLAASLVSRSAGPYVVRHTWLNARNKPLSESGLASNRVI